MNHIMPQSDNENPQNLEKYSESPNIPGGSRYLKKQPTRASRQPRPTEAELLIQQQETSEWSGPLPPPDAIREYSLLLRDSPERLFRMAELEQEHRHKMDNRVESRASRSLHYAVGLIAASVLFAGIAMFTGHPEIALTIFKITIGVIAGAFIVNTVANAWVDRNQMQLKSKQLEVVSKRLPPPQADPELPDNQPRLPLK